jgi:hypothetical protein
VGGIHLRTGLIINGLAVTFMRINGRTLDSSQAYTSEWLGDRTGGSEEYLGGAGAPVVGVFGREDEKHVSALGLVFATVPPALTRLATAPLPQPARLPVLVNPPTAASPPASVSLLPPGQAASAPATGTPARGAPAGKGIPWPAIALVALAGGLICVGLLVGGRKLFGQPRAYDAIVVDDDEPSTQVPGASLGDVGPGRPARSHGEGESRSAAAR